MWIWQTQIHTGAFTPVTLHEVCPMRQLHVFHTKHIDVDNLQLASPCSAKWKDMRGDDRTRLCLACEKNVYNLEAMTRREIHALIVETEGQFCGRLYKRKGGTVLTADCPLGLREKVGLAAHRLSLTVFLAAMTLVLAVLALVPRTKVCTVSSPVTHQPEPRPFVNVPVPSTIERVEDAVRKTQMEAERQREATMPRPGGMG
jgi:hypothetical protein